VNNLNKILVIFYILLASSYGVYIFTTSEGLEESLLELVLPQKITDFEVSRIVDVPINRIFDVMADIENFPNVIPSNILDVTIISKTNDVIIAEEELSEIGIKTKLIVKHTIKPYNEHVIEIIEGDAKGTIITQYFESVGSQTKLTTNVHLNVEGVTSVIKFLPESNLKHAVNTIISYFVNYSTYDVYDKVVNSIYEEILNRPADVEGLSYYSTLLRNEKITEEGIKELLFTSKEKNMMINIKSIDELNPETIKVISRLYENFLLRESDPEGLQYYGNLFENGTSYDEIRTMFLDSNEFVSLFYNHPATSKITSIYKLIYDKKEPEKFEVDYYHKMIDDGITIVPNWTDYILNYRQMKLISTDEASDMFRYLQDKGIVLIEKIPLNEQYLK
jgi:ribosome-associated toxin RatA of RatAB toxin-antitoxin module